MRYDHIAQLENAASDYVAYVIPDQPPSWDELNAMWFRLEEDAQCVDYDVFDLDDYTVGVSIRKLMTQFRIALLHLEAHVAMRLSEDAKCRVPIESHVRATCDRDVTQLREKDAAYGASWKRRGGVGAFMMTCRKWDRLEQQVKKFNNDIFQAMLHDHTPEGIWDDVGDLRRYFVLIEAELLARIAVDGVV